MRDGAIGEIAKVKVLGDQVTGKKPEDVFPLLRNECITHPPFGPLTLSLSPSGERGTGRAPVRGAERMNASHSQFRGQ